MTVMAGRQGMTMDIDVLRQLRDLPDDLRLRGWTFSIPESNVLRWGSSPRYNAVYLRSFEPGVDDAHSVPVVRRNARDVIRVSTRSTSWEAAREDAIGLMRAMDAHRRDAP